MMMMMTTTRGDEQRNTNWRFTRSHGEAFSWRETSPQGEAEDDEDRGCLMLSLLRLFFLLSQLTPAFLLPSLQLRFLLRCSVKWAHLIRGLWCHRSSITPPPPPAAPHPTPVFTNSALHPSPSPPCLSCLSCYSVLVSLDVTLASPRFLRHLVFLSFSFFYLKKFDPRLLNI